MLRLKKKLKKRIAIIGIPVATLCVVSYLSLTFFSQGSKSTFAYEHYYENKNENESNGVEIPTEGAVVDIDDDSTEEVVEVIKDHDSVVLDTNPESITVMVNKELSLPSDYIPADLVVPNVTFSIQYYDEKKLMREEAARALEKLFLAASQKGLYFNAVSGYRSYDRQYDIFTNNIKTQGLKHTLAYSAIPGYSEHQTGLSMDVSTKSVNNRLDESFAETPEGIWLKDNAHLYGYIIRYAEDKPDITGYSYEPWHIRYVGKALALYLYENNLSLEEYYNFVPKLDSYSNITINELVANYGIALADMIKPTVIPTATPSPSITPTESVEEEEGTGEETDDETSDGELGDDEDSDSTDTEEDGTGGDSDIDPTTSPDEETDGDTTGTVTPTKAPGNQGTVTPTPTVTVAPTQTPGNQGTVTPTPSVTPTQSVTG